MRAAAAFAPLTTGTKKLLLGPLLISKKIVLPLISVPPLRELPPPLVVFPVVPPQAASNRTRRAQNALITTPRGGCPRKIESFRCLFMADLSLLKPQLLCFLTKLFAR